MSGYEALIYFYPEVEHRTKVSSGKVRDHKHHPTTKVKLRKSNWKQLEELWKQLSKRQMIKFDNDVNDLAQTVAEEIFKDNENKIFVRQRPQMIKQKVITKNNQAVIQESPTDYENNYLTMKYGSFLKKLATQTDLPVNFLHQQMIAAIKRLNGNKDYINEKTLGNLVREFNKRFNERIKN